MYSIRKLLPLFAAAGTVAAAQGWAQEGRGPYYGPHMWDSGWGMVFGPLTMIVILVAIVVAVVALIRWMGGGHMAGPAAPPGKAPIDILKERFARGEIDTEEFEERRKLLE